MRDTQNDLVVFIGDSIIQELETPKIWQNSCNYGMGGDTTFGMLSRLPMVSEIPHAEAIIVSIGINDFWFGSPSEAILDTYDDILSFFPKSSKVLLNSVLPIDENCPSTPKNSEIDWLNTELEKLCADFDNCKFCNSNPLLKGENNSLRTEFHLGDGVHLSDKGYSVFSNFLKEQLLKTLS